MAIKNIVLDYGHGGMDKYGKYTTAPAKMFVHPNKEIAYEGVINRQIGKRIFDLLSYHKDVNVVETVAYNDPKDTPLVERVLFANRYKASDTLLISIHGNASNSKARGFELFTTKGKTKSDDLATCIIEEVEPMYKNLGIPLRYDTSDRDKDKEADFYIIKKVSCIAVLIEVLFFDNFEDFKLLKDEKFQCDFANCVYRGVMKYISQNK